MNDLIKINTNAQGQQLVSGRELYDVLGIKVHFSTWMKRMCEYGFQEKIDFSILKSGNPNGGIDRVDDYAITIDMAKHIAMLQRTEIGMKVRNYFIECEKIAKQLVVRDSYLIEDPIERAKRWIEEQEEKRALELMSKEQQLVIEEQQKDIEHKEDVIISLTQDITLAEKRQRINDIVKYGARGRYAERWNLLYKEFDSKFHVDSKRRMDNAKTQGKIKKSMNRMDYICDIMGMTVDLYDLATVVFEADYIDMLQSYINTAKRK